MEITKEMIKAMVDELEVKSGDHYTDRGVIDGNWVSLQKLRIDTYMKLCVGGDDIEMEVDI